MCRVFSPTSAGLSITNSLNSFIPFSNQIQWTCWLTLLAPEWMCPQGFRRLSSNRCSSSFRLRVGNLSIARRNWRRLGWPGYRYSRFAGQENFPNLFATESSLIAQGAQMLKSWTNFTASLKPSGSEAPSAGSSKSFAFQTCLRQSAMPPSDSPTSPIARR